MPTLNWDAFATLPGSVDKNFESLCRGSIRQNFGSYGVFHALANQPGVEFHLKIERRCNLLGDPGRWWGWQCKWYDLPASGTLGVTRRKKIEDGIRKTEVHVPEVTDWVLWTRHPLTKSDQKWFNDLSSGLTLHLWTGEDIENLLVGQAAILRSTYFGELVLTPEILASLHERSVAPVRLRWQPEVHHVVEAEHRVRRMLGESASWNDLHTLSVDLRSQGQSVLEAPAVPNCFSTMVARVVEEVEQTAQTLQRVADGISGGDLDALRDEVLTRSSIVSEVITAPRRLRSGNHLASLHVTNAVAACHEAARLLNDVEAAFAVRLVAVLAPAGCGKTQLAAQLTVGTEMRPHGVLFHGRDLHANHTLDDLAKRIPIAGNPIPSIQALLAAVNAAGQRARCRLPVVFDGLNESEDPRKWKSLIAELERMLVNYPYVLVVCTLRPEFESEVLPHDIERLEIAGFDGDIVKVIRSFFYYYKIDGTDTQLPSKLLRHPLTLRLFCEVANPTRENVVDAGSMPRSLTALFDRYLDQVSERVADLSPRTQRYYTHDVRKALGVFAKTLWNNKARSVDFDELRQALGDEHRPWDQSLVRALELEGVLFRIPSVSQGSGAYALLYDLLGGHIIANELLVKYGQVGFELWIKEASTIPLLIGDYNERHPLAGDVVYSLVGQIPRRFHSKQLWQLVEEPLRTHALRSTARLEAAYLDAATVEALLDLVRQGDADILHKIWETRGTEKHPLNADALDQVLRSMEVADRDLYWTEWIRNNQKFLIRDIEDLEKRWQLGEIRSGDRLRACWVMWTLTSTVRRLRDQATRALYWFGCNDVAGLFDLTINSLTVNDAYVGERMIAASYGVVMRHQRVEADFVRHLNPFLQQLASALVGSTATAPTLHYLTRLYTSGIVTFAKKFYNSEVPDMLCGDWSFADPPPVMPIPNDAEHANEVGDTLHMDFENYTLGLLFEDRSNYDMEHPGHQAAVSYVRGVVWSLGWRAVKFETLDGEIGSGSFRVEGREGGRTERYGKKYGWIGFFNYAGMLETQDLLPEDGRRISSVDIDPAFPQQPPIDGDPVTPHAWLNTSVNSHESWLRESITEVPRHFLVRDQIGEHAGPWIAANGYVRVVDKVIGREVWAFLSAFVTPKESLASLMKALETGIRPWIARWIPSDFYTFSGEIPWHPNFAANARSDSGIENIYRESVQVQGDHIAIEVLAHHYTWESYHSEMNRSGDVRVPSRRFSEHFDLRSTPQGFDQCLPDGTRATIALRGIDGLEGDILYIREDLFYQYIGDRTVVWFAFGERELSPYPSPPPQWVVDIRRERINEWQVVLTKSDLTSQEGKKFPTKKALRKTPAKKTSRKNA